MKRLRNLDWEAIAGITAAMAALILHFLHIVDEGILLAMALVLMALLLIRDFRREHNVERVGACAARTELAVKDIQAALKAPDAILVGPSGLRSTSEQFVRRGQGEMTWFNVCLLMFRGQLVFDTLLRPAIENPRVTSIQFISNESEKNLWQSNMVPKLAACPGSEKVKEPLWRKLDETISFILAETISGDNPEALLSFWGEPFMVRSAGANVPRYIFHVQGHSELITRLKEQERSYRISQ